MKRYIKQYSKYFDYPLFITYVLLALFGLLMVYSSSMLYAVQAYNPPREPTYFLKKQLFHVILAIPIFFAASFFPHRHYRNKKVMGWTVLIMLVSLFSVHFLGHGKEEVGSQSWIRTPIGNFQPSELAKVLITIYFAAVFANKADKGELNISAQSIGKPLAVLLLMLLSIMLETDLGATLIIGVIGVAVLAASDLTGKQFWKLVGRLTITIGPFVVLLIWIFWDKIATPSRLGRFIAFRDIFEHQYGSGFQVLNSIVAIGSGGITGLGLGNSIQKLGYLPEPHTDMIMAVISEELGIFGVSIVLGGIGYIVVHGFLLALRTKHSHTRMIAVGISTLFAIQTILNVGGLTRSIPLTGVTLPFISYGGTSFILLSLALGILMNVSMFVKKEQSDKGV